MTARLAMSEKEWQALVVDVARLHGWAHFHTYDSRRSNPGWPDLVLVRPPEMIVVELKTDRGRVSPVQDDVLRMLRACAVEAHVWRPCDEPVVFARLTRQRVAA